MASWRRAARFGPDETAAIAKAIEYFHVEPALQFRVVVTKLDKAKECA